MHLNIENFLDFSNPGYQVIRHLFILTTAAFAAGLVYFIASAGSVSKRYRNSSFISGAVMISAAFAIYHLYLLLGEAFSYNVEAEAWQPVETAVFSNGNRYVNWSIDVPMLLTQFLIVLGVSGDYFWSQWRKFTIAGLLMIWTGYVGQFYEGYRVEDGINPVPFWLWGGISTVFYLYLYVVLAKTVSDTKDQLSERARGQAILAWRILFFSWILYPVAYAIPALLPSSEWIVVRQVAYTIADITSKLIYGIVLARMAIIRTQEEENPHVADKAAV